MKFSYFIVLLFVLLSYETFGCPFIILNDKDTPILIVDPYNKQAVYIKPQEKREIDPSISGWRYYIYYERLDIYEPYPDNSNLFYRHYQLKEKKCVETTTELSLSSIMEYSHTPSDRFETYIFSPHTHEHHSH